MFLPLYDGLSYLSIRTAWVTYSILVLSCIYYIGFILGLFPTPYEDEVWISAAFGVIPAVLLGKAVLPDGLPLVPDVLTLVTGQFVHLSMLHLISNMLFLFVLGDNVEDAMGHLRFIIFYVASGIAGALAYVAANPDSVRPLVGASGSISGIIAAYLILYPRVRLWGLFLNRIPLHLPAFWAIGFWVAFQIFQVWFGSDDIGWVAHLGGFVSGALLVIIMRRSGVPLFGRRPEAVENEACGDLEAGRKSAETSPPVDESPSWKECKLYACNGD